MKYTFLLIALSAFALQTTLANPRPAEVNASVNVEATGFIRDIFGEVIDGLGSVADEFVSAFKNAGQSGADAAANFATQLKTATDLFLQQAIDYATSIGQDVSDFAQQTVANFGATVQALHTNVALQIQVTQDNVKRAVLIEIENQLEKINESAQILQNFVLTVHDKTSEHILNQQQAILAQWNNWASKELNFVAEQVDGDQVVLNEVQTIINEFINRYSNYVNSCADQVEVEMQNYESQVQDTVSGYQIIVEQLIQEVEDCLAGEDGIIAGLQCQRKARAVLRKLRSIPSDFNKLVRQGNKLIRADFARNTCVVQTLTQWKLESYAIERKINRIIIAHGSSSASNSNSASVSNSESGSVSDSNSASVSDSVSVSG